ncbi:MAG: DNA strand exchange inhibitor protein [Phycisphaerales bacterium]|nr:DNA strand exchange inhibitor protein [Phycisphaerales bacterium]MCB9862387.1 DNA strand exchange inhibitor protein [Phycisphaerales bacterium]
MDAHTLEKLEFERIREWLARHAQCALGKSLAMHVRPSRKPKQVRHWIGQLEQFMNRVAARGMPPFGGIRDVRENVRRAVPPNKLEPEEFAELADTLNGVAAVRVWFDKLGENEDKLAKLSERLADLRVIRDRINRVVDSRGLVRDDASERLQRIRDDLERIRQEAHELFDKLLKQPAITKYLQYANATYHADRMVLPLRADQHGRVPGIVHRSSDSGQTLFVEPAQAVELNNRRVNMLQAEKEEISRILWELTHLVHLNQKPLLETLETLAVIDLLSAKTKLADRFNMRLPAINDDGKLNMIAARNPILLEMYEDAKSEHYIEPDGETRREVVPIDARLGEDFDIALVTGPNTGGKTAALKTVGLVVLMAQAGLPIPAAGGTTLPVFSGLWIDVGDEQSLQQSLSTFSAHMGRILDIVQRARKGTLVLIDEMGAGTDPDEGAAIGRAIVDHLLSTGCLAMITTHLGALKAVGFEQERADNASVEFDIETLRPTYRLLIGEPGNSNAIAIASRLGMPKKLVNSAKRNMARRHRALNKAIAGTLTARRGAEQARRDAEQARQDAARETLAALDKVKDLESRIAQYDTWVKRIVSLKPGEAVRVRKFDDPGKIVRVRLEKQRAVVSVGAIEVEVPLSDLIFQ